MKRTVICIILWSMVLAWIIFLVCMSAQHGNVSGRMSGNILEEVYDRADDDTIDKEVFDKDLYVRANQGKIRRTAHLVIFTVLGVLAASASLYTFGKKAIGFILPIFITISYSFIDELIQLVTPGRAFEWSDLQRDMIGSVIGIAFVFVVYLIILRIRAK